MKSRATLYAFIALCLLGAVALLIEHRFRSTDEQKQQASTLLQIVPDNINYLGMTRGDLHVECIKRSGRWFLRNPQDAPVVHRRIGTILRLLAIIPKENAISFVEIRDKQLTLNDYGLVKPRALFVLGDGQSRQELSVGSDAPLGNMVYVTLEGSEEIASVIDSVLDLIPEQVDDLRERSLFSITAEKVGYAYFQKDGSRLVLTKGDGGWVITDPVQYKADDQIMDALIQEITALRVTSFINEPVTNFTEMGLEPPVYAVHLAEDVNDAEPAGPNRLLIGLLREGAATVFAKYGEAQFACEISSSSVKAFVDDMTNPLKYVSRTILQIPEKSIHQVAILKNGSKQVVARDESGEWTSVLPVDKAVDQETIRDALMFAADLRALRVEALDPTDLSVYGLDNPRSVLSLGFRDGQERQTELFIGSGAKRSGMYAMIKEQHIVFVLEEVLAELLTRSLVYSVATDKRE
jgi:hypothetical protein